MELPQIKHVHKPLTILVLLFILANFGFSFPSEPQGMSIQLIMLAFFYFIFFIIEKRSTS
jgi:hypothetical protein